jgi:hypothetical protein
MEIKVLLDQAASTDISGLRGKVISYVKLHLSEKSQLTTCILRFYNEEDSEEESAWVKMVKPGFNTAHVLVPDTDACFLVLDYDHCVVTDLHGRPLDDCNFTMLINEIAA